MCSKDQERMVNCVDNPDQTALLEVIWVYTICSGSSVWKFRTIMVSNANYRKIPKILDTRKFSVITLKFEIWTRRLFLRVMHPKDAEGIANSVDPDQTAPLGAVWSGSALFAQTCLSENLGTLRYAD